MKLRVVTAGIIRKEGRELILLTRRGPDESLAGYWEFPGGKVEKGESEQDCLKRELREEHAIEVQVKGFVAETLYRYEHGQFLLRAYDAIINQGEIKLSVHDKYEWVEAFKILGFPLAPADIQIANALQDNTAKADAGNCIDDSTHETQGKLQ